MAVAGMGRLQRAQFGMSRSSRCSGWGEGGWAELFLDLDSEPHGVGTRQNDPLRVFVGAR